MKTADFGSTVTIRYTIAFEDGTPLGDGKNLQSLSFRIGSGKVFKALEEGIIGMKEHETRDIHLTPEKSYGVYRKDLVLQLDRTEFPEGMPLVPGRTVQYQDRDGERINFMVNEVRENTVIVDGNHPLAGKNLVYKVEVLTIS